MSSKPIGLDEDNIFQLTIWAQLFEPVARDMGKLSWADLSPGYFGLSLGLARLVSIFSLCRRSFCIYSHRYDIRWFAPAGGRTCGFGEMRWTVPVEVGQGIHMSVYEHEELPLQIGINRANIGSEKWFDDG